MASVASNLFAGARLLTKEEAAKAQKEEDTRIAKIAASEKAAQDRADKEARFARYQELVKSLPDLQKELKALEKEFAGKTDDKEPKELKDTK